MRLMVFSKHLAGKPLEAVAKRLRQINIKEIDLTVRAGGHIEPTHAEEELPLAAQSLASEGVGIGMISTGITQADTLSENVLRAAKAVGVNYYKLGYFTYEGFGTLRKQRTEARAKLRDLAQLNADLGLTGGYHNHSDAFLGASLWDIDFLLEGISPNAMGLYFDPCHAVIEGGSSGWKMGLDLLQERVVMLAAKDFRWVEAGKRYAGARAHSVEFCPLKEGNVPWEELGAYLKAMKFQGPVSFHSEYQGDHSFRDLSVEDVLVQTAEDIQTFRSLSRLGEVNT